MVSTMIGGGVPIGPFSNGKIIKTGNGQWGYSAGQLGKCLETGKLVGTKPAEQAE